MNIEKQDVYLAFAFGQVSFRPTFTLHTPSAGN